jgi:hypothetical protein
MIPNYTIIDKQFLLYHIFQNEDGDAPIGLPMDKEHVAKN